ncbi:MAG: hypothetical protein OXH00_21390 [Candidatus Poribacteria bacterium]|nr:hypothetical protein [Candidatus Poribacteria bacterium]
MYKYTFRLPSYKLWEYEFELAKREIRSLISPDGQLVLTQDGFQIEQVHPININKLKNLCFFHCVVVDSENQSEVINTQQAISESSAKIADRAMNFAELQQKIETLVPNRRKVSTYGVHGLHTYKGKFYPQLVKSLINYSGVASGSVFLDPFMGCGTAVIEGFLTGMVAIGIDMNPLAHFISKTRLSCLNLSAEDVEREFNTLLANLEKHLPDGDTTSALDVATVTDLGMRLSLKYEIEDIEYLISWFPLPVLYKLFRIVQAIECISIPAMRDFFFVTLSDMMNDVSQQKPTQLRIGRRAEPITDAPVYKKFSELVHRNTFRLRAFLNGLTSERLTHDFSCFLGDIRHVEQIQSPYLKQDNRVDIIITSPPYATALPYIDTDRLSLAFLNLLNKRQKPAVERALIGSREIQTSLKNQLEQEFFDNYNCCPLPQDIKETIKHIYDLNHNAQVGFRRKNKPSLLYRYFMDMRTAMLQMHRLLKKDGACMIIIGDNVTTAGDAKCQIPIPTARFLGLIAESIGFQTVEEIPITVSRESVAHFRNAITRNKILILRRG